MLKQTALVLFGMASTAIAQQAPPATYALDPAFTAPRAAVEEITRKELKKHLTFIASDELKGRDTGSPELDVAARYLAAHLESYGFKGAGPGGSWFQEVKLHKSSYDVTKATFTFNKKSVAWEIGKDAAIYGMGTESFAIDAPIVFTGDGLLTDQHKSYDPAQVKDAIAVRMHLEGELANLAKTNQAYSHQMARNTLFKNGAKAVILVVKDNDAATQLIRLYSTFAQQPNLTLKKGEQQGVYIILNSAGYDKLLAAAKIKPAKDPAKAVPPVFKGRAALNLASAYAEVKTKNVLAILEGTDPVLKKEIVGWGAHYDHVGYRDTMIFNGADDDGSGTVGVLNIAKALAAAPPKRSTMVIFHTGEEKGLFGSEFYADNPTIDLKNMVAMVNMDMIGSDYQLDKVHVVGADRISRELHDINEAVNRTGTAMTLDYTYNDDNHPERIYYRSDHYNYAKKGVPIIFYTNDNPKHYHKHTDEVGTINFEKMERIARLAYQTGYYVANKPARLVLNPVSGTN